jgi:hypothetical protein
MNILIYAPSYHQGSGGTRVLHYLGYLLTLAGHNVKMTCLTLNKEWPNYSIQSLTNFDLRILSEVYPSTLPKEINTVRWVLYFPGKLSSNSPLVYPLHEMVVAYDTAYHKATIDASGGRHIPIFYLPYLDMNGMDDNIPRHNPGAVWYGKGKNLTVKPKEIEGLPIITRTWPYPRENLIWFLKSTISIYSFDPNTAINEEAIMCGCNVFLWDGEKFNPYSNENPNRAIMNIPRDLINVCDFLETVKRYFDI